MRKNKKGFSLIELVIVIAILAVLAAVLAPALIHYVEDSRATSDTHSMDEVVNAVQIGLANPEAYDEMVDASVDGNVSCYIDSNSESGRDKEIVKVGANGTAYYTFSDDNRLLDETPYTAAGNMRGVTITFIPDTSSDSLTYDLKNAVINKHVGGTAKLSDYPNLYNRVRQTIGDTITLDSNTYGNSEYTIFIRIGSGGGSQATAQDPIQVYGQYNGTNLPKSYTSGGTAADRDDTYTPPTNTNPPSGGGTGTGGTPVTPPPPVGGGGTGGGTGTQTPSNGIPTGGTYIQYVNGRINPDNGYAWEYDAMNTYNAGDPWPTTTNKGDIYKYGNYEYCYGYWWCSQGCEEWSHICSDEFESEGWAVHCVNNVPQPGQFLSSINGQTLTDVSFIFFNCTNLQDNGVPQFNNGITKMRAAFASCASLTNVNNIKLPVSVTEIEHMFQDSGVKTANNFVIPEQVTSIYCLFEGCDRLISAPTIPSNINNMYHAFEYCASLTGTIQINANLRHEDSYDTFDCFFGTEKDIIITGSCAMLDAIAESANNGNVQVQ